MMGRSARARTSNSKFASPWLNIEATTNPMDDS